LLRTSTISTRRAKDARLLVDRREWARRTLLRIPTDAATVFAKNSYDAFTNEELVATLERMNARYVIVRSVRDGCVMASICGGFSKGTGS